MSHDFAPHQGIGSSNRSRSSYSRTNSGTRRSSRYSNKSGVTSRKNYTGSSSAKRKTSTDTSYEQMRASMRKSTQDYLKMVDAKYGNTNFDEIADSLERDGYDAGARYYRKLANTKRNIEEIGNNAQKFLSEYKNLAATGMPQSKIFQTLSSKYNLNNNVSRETLVEKLQNMGYTKEYAENAIPKDFDERLKQARKDGVEEVNNRYKSSAYKTPEGNPLQLTESEQNNIIDA